MHLLRKYFLNSMEREEVQPHTAPLGMGIGTTLTFLLLFITKRRRALVQSSIGVDNRSSSANSPNYQLSARRGSEACKDLI